MTSDRSQCIRPPAGRPGSRPLPPPDRAPPRSRPARAAELRADRPQHDRRDDPAIPDLVALHVEGEPNTEYERAEAADRPQHVAHRENARVGRRPECEGGEDDHRRDERERGQNVQEQEGVVHVAETYLRRPCLASGTPGSRSPFPRSRGTARSGSVSPRDRRRFAGSGGSGPPAASCRRRGRRRGPHRARCTGVSSGTRRPPASPRTGR